MKRGWSRRFTGHNGLVEGVRAIQVEPSMCQNGQVFFLVEGPGKDQRVGAHITRADARKLAAHVLKCAGIRSLKEVLP